MASTSLELAASAVNAVAAPPSEVMISTVCCAAAWLRSTQNTCAPSRAKVTAVALPLPQPGPIEPAPTTIAVLPLSRSIDFLLPVSFSFSCSPGEAKRNPGILPHNFPDFASLHPGYGSIQTLMVVTFAPIGWPKISDNVLQLPSWHSRHS